MAHSPTTTGDYGRAGSMSESAALGAEQMAHERSRSRGAMSGPGGSTTKRDQRREARRADLQRVQLERQRQRARERRNQQIRIGGGIGLAAVLIIGLAVLLVSHSGTSSTGKTTGTGLAPASGQTVDGIACNAGEGTTQHYHSYLEVFVNGEQQTVPPGTGIVAPQGAGGSALASNGNQVCLYALHVHDGEPNIVHIESPNNSRYTLGQFFDIWGEQLSATQVMGNSVDATHTLTFEVFDAAGKLTTVTSDPRAITFAEHETIAILYNTPATKAQPFTNWKQYNL